MVNKTSGTPQKKKVKKTRNKKAGTSRKCGLCGKGGNLIKTECCDQWICDDESQYVMFSYNRNSCSRNHTRYTLCGFHYCEEHEGHWQDCEKCRENFETEMYVWYGTNEFNFEKLKNIPSYEPTVCAKCNNIIKLGEDGYSMQGSKYFCDKCSGVSF
ncbi:MAG: hypothetical protein KAS17_00855 [Victivallaceae bacterium]|nr:hypothetical protein [Victivallaceae bacterium]